MKRIFITVAAMTALTACNPLPESGRAMDFTHVRTGAEPTEAQERAGDAALAGVVVVGGCAVAGKCF